MLLLELCSGEKAAAGLAGTRSAEPGDSSRAAGVVVRRGERGMRLDVGVRGESTARSELGAGSGLYAGDEIMRALRCGATGDVKAQSGAALGREAGMRRSGGRTGMRLCGDDPRPLPLPPPRER